MPGYCSLLLYLSSFLTHSSTYLPPMRLYYVCYRGVLAHSCFLALFTKFCIPRFKHLWHILLSIFRWETGRGLTNVLNFCQNLNIYILYRTGLSVSRGPARLFDLVVDIRKHQSFSVPSLRAAGPCINVMRYSRERKLAVSRSRIYPIRDDSAGGSHITDVLDMCVTISFHMLYPTELSCLANHHVYLPLSLVLTNMNRPRSLPLWVPFLTPTPCKIISRSIWLSQTLKYLIFAIQKLHSTQLSMQ